MSETNTIQPGDPRLGRFAADGSIAEWPKTDYHGQPYNPVNGSVYRMGSQFVVFGPNREPPELVLTIGPIAPQQPTIVPEPTPEPSTPVQTVPDDTIPLAPKRRAKAEPDVKPDGEAG